MKMNEEQKKNYERYFNELKTCDPQALANELACMFVFVPLIPVEKILGQIRQNSKIVRNNKRIVARNKKISRLNELCNKKRRTVADNKEAIKLCRELGIDIENMANDE